MGFKDYYFRASTMNCKAAEIINEYQRGNFLGLVGNRHLNNLTIDKHVAFGICDLTGYPSVAVLPEEILPNDHLQQVVVADYDYHWHDNSVHMRVDYAFSSTINTLSPIIADRPEETNAK